MFCKGIYQRAEHRGALTYEFNFFCDSASNSNYSNVKSNFPHGNAINLF